MAKLAIHTTQQAGVDIIVAMENDAENAPFIFPNTKEEHEQMLVDPDVEHLILKVDEKVIGFVILAGLKNKNKSIELKRIVIHQKGKGFGRRTIKAIKRRCFEERNCHRLWLDVLETNDRARKLYLTEGFKEEGKLREAIRIDNKFIDLILMSILDREYKNPNSGLAF